MGLFQEIVIMAFGASMMFGAASLYLTQFVKSEYRGRRVPEVIYAILIFSVFVLGYILTKNLILGVITSLIVVTIFIASVASYLQCEIRARKVRISKSFSTSCVILQMPRLTRST